MSSKTMYWIRDAEGVHAQVEGAEQRDVWTKVRGWAETGEPGPTDLVHVVNENPEIAQGHPLPYGALPGWEGYGFHAAPPPEPAGTPQVSAPDDQPVAVPVKPAKVPAAAGADQKEK